MKLIVLAKRESDYGRAVEEFMRELIRQYPDKQIEQLDLDTREGAETAKLYDVTRYPAILAIANDGGLVQLWQGMPLPLRNDIAAYMR